MESPCPEEDLRTSIIEQVMHEPVWITPYSGECDLEYDDDSQRMQCELLLWYADREECHVTWHALHESAIRSFDD